MIDITDKRSQIITFALSKFYHIDDIIEDDIEIYNVVWNVVKNKIRDKSKIIKAIYGLNSSPLITEFIIPVISMYDRDLASKIEFHLSYTVLKIIMNVFGADFPIAYGVSYANKINPIDFYNISKDSIRNQQWMHPAVPMTKILHKMAGFDDRIVNFDINRNYQNGPITYNGLINNIFQIAYELITDSPSLGEVVDAIRGVNHIPSSYTSLLGEVGSKYDKYVMEKLFDIYKTEKTDEVFELTKSVIKLLDKRHPGTCLDDLSKLFGFMKSCRNAIPVTTHIVNNNHNYSPFTFMFGPGDGEAILKFSIKKSACSIPGNIPPCLGLRINFLNKKEAERRGLIPPNK